MKDKTATHRIITWKDADQAMCRLAASIFDDASNLRGFGQFRPKEVDAPDGVFNPGDGDDSDPERAFYSVGWNNITADLPIDSAIPGDDRNPISSLCWYSFSNMVRMRLRAARQEIEDNLYGRGDRFKTSKQASRNPVKRQKGSKFKREPER